MHNSQVYPKIQPHYTSARPYSYSRSRGRSRRRKSSKTPSFLSIVCLVLAAWLIYQVLIYTEVLPGSSTDELLANSSSEVAVLLRNLEVVSDDYADSVPDYDRDEFGTAWADVDLNGCDTRNDVLARDLTDITLDSDQCTVLSGTLADPYTGKTISFTRGKNTSSQVQIDHVVALSNAWHSGAWQWSLSERTQFANDKNNLLAVSGSANSEKGAASADQWMPEEKGFYCEYASIQIQIKSKYSLAITQAEKDTLAHVIVECS